MSISLLLYTIVGFIIAWSNVLYKHPALTVIRNVLNLTYTLVHEFAHAFFALIGKGQVLEMELHYVTSGHVVSSSADEDHALLVTFVGYTVPCVIAASMYILLDAGRSGLVLILFIAIGALSILFIRNWYGFFWLVGFLTLVVATYMYGTVTMMDHVAMFLAAVVFAGSVEAGYRIFIMSIRTPHDAGDATSLGEQMWIPAQLWGFIFFVCSFATLVFVPAYFYVDAISNAPYVLEFKAWIARD